MTKSKEDYYGTKEEVLDVMVEFDIKGEVTTFIDGKRLLVVTYHKQGEQRKYPYSTIVLVLDMLDFGLFSSKLATKDEEARKTEGWWGLNKATQTPVILNGRFWSNLCSPSEEDISIWIKSRSEEVDTGDGGKFTNNMKVSDGKIAENGSRYTAP